MKNGSKFSLDIPQSSNLNYFNQNLRLKNNMSMMYSPFQNKF